MKEGYKPLEGLRNDEGLKYEVIRALGGLALTATACEGLYALVSPSEYDWFWQYYISHIPGLS